jgi:PAS domain S-box-containing protein
VSEFSDLQRLTEALRAREAQLKAVIECLPFDFWMIGNDGAYVMQNSSCRALWGEIVGKRPQDLDVDPVTLALWHDNNRRAFAGESVRGEVELTVRGETRHFYNVVAPITGEHGTSGILGILGINLDITERKEVEQELSRRNEALRRANEQLAAVNRSKDRMTAMISHELRNPLVTGLGYVEMLLDHKFGAIPELAEAKMLVAERNLQRLSMLVDLVLKYHRLLDASHDDRWPVAPFDLPTVAQEIVNESRDFGEVARKVRLELEASLPQVIGDRELIRLVLTNLLDNAKAHAGPEAAVQILCRRVSDHEVEVTVEDDGVGIPSEIQKSVFEPFVRGTTEHSGFGLGLAIVRAVLAVHHAEVTLESTEGKGTVVRFRLPSAR